MRSPAQSAASHAAPSPTLTLSRSPGLCQAFPDSYFPSLVVQCDNVIRIRKSGDREIGSGEFSPLTPSRSHALTAALQPVLDGDAGEAEAFTEISPIRFNSYLNAHQV